MKTCYENVFGGIIKTSAFTNKKDYSLGEKQRPENIQCPKFPQHEGREADHDETFREALGRKANKRYDRHRESVKPNDDRLATKRSKGKERRSVPITVKRNFFRLEHRPTISATTTSFDARTPAIAKPKQQCRPALDKAIAPKPAPVTGERLIFRTAT